MSADEYVAQNMATNNAITRCQDPGGDYRRLDLHDFSGLDGTYDAIWASGCLYHLKKPEFACCGEDCHVLMAPNGVLYRRMKEGDGEHFEHQSGTRYPGGAEAQTRLRGKRFYTYYGRDDLITLLQVFERLRKQRVEPSKGGFELWLRRS